MASNILFFPYVGLRCSTRTLGQKCSLSKPLRQALRQLLAAQTGFEITARPTLMALASIHLRGTSTCNVNFLKASPLDG